MSDPIITMNTKTRACTKKSAGIVKASSMHDKFINFKEPKDQQHFKRSKPLRRPSRVWRKGDKV